MSSHSSHLLQIRKHIWRILPTPPLRSRYRTLSEEFLHIYNLLTSFSSLWVSIIISSWGWEFGSRRKNLGPLILLIFFYFSPVLESFPLSLILQLLKHKSQEENSFYNHFNCNVPTWYLGTECPVDIMGEGPGIKENIWKKCF